MIATRKHDAIAKCKKDDAAKAVNKFADGIEALLPEMMEFSKKYPELKDKSNLPEELKEIDKKVTEMSKKMVDAMIKLMPYMMNPKILDVEKRLGSVMTKNRKIHALVLVCSG